MSELDDVLARARSWLCAAVTAPPPAPAPPLRALLQAVVGLEICERNIPAPAPALADELLRRVRETLRGERFDPAGHDPRLLLLCLRHLDRTGGADAALKDFADGVNDALGQRSAVPGRRLVEARLLHELGLRPAPRPAPAVRVTVGAEPYTLLLADAARIRALCEDVALATGFGTVRGALAQRTRADLAAVLPTVAVQALRCYDLELGATLLRVLGYLRVATSRQARSVAAFLTAQQQPDGRFGYFGAELATVTGTADATFDVHVPVTVACMWSLAEASRPAFRLFGPSTPVP